MATKLYQLTLCNGTRAVPGTVATVVSLDLEDSALSGRRLNRHLYGASDRAGINRQNAHMNLLEVRPVDPTSLRVGDVVLRWAVPAPPVPDRDDDMQ